MPNIYDANFEEREGPPGFRSRRARLGYGEEYLRGCGARRITALVAFEDGAAGAFWDVAGYPPDPVIGRRVRNL